MTLQCVLHKVRPVAATRGRDSMRIGDRFAVRQAAYIFRAPRVKRHRFDGCAGHRFIGFVGLLSISKYSLGCGRDCTTTWLRPGSDLRSSS